MEEMEEYELTEAEKEGLSDFLKDMPSQLSYIPSKPHWLYKPQKSPWVFWSHPPLSSDYVRSTTPIADVFDLVVKEKITSALQNLKFHRQVGGGDIVLYQFWAPVTIEGRCFLTTSDQPFALTKIDNLNLQSYRKHSLGYKFRVDEEENLGLPGRVFRTKVLEWTPYIRYYSNKEFPQRCHAVNCNFDSSLALPVFQSNGQVIGVLESIFTRFKPVDLWHFVGTVYGAFQGDLQNTIDEIKEVFKVVCNTHRLPFAQTWVLCKHCSDVAYGDGYVCPNEEILIPLGRASYVWDANIYEFSFVQNYLKKGQGVPGKAYSSHNSCFCRDVTQLNMFQYPMAHLTRHCGLAGSFAICLRSSKTGDQDYVLEFFMPPSESNCEDPTKTLLDPIMVTMKQHFRTFKLSSGKELGDELSVEVLELDMCEKLGPLKLCQTTRSPPRSEPLQGGRETTEVDPQYQQSMVEAINEGRNDNVSAERTDEAVPCSEKEATAVNTNLEKDHNDNEISISYEVLKQHFGMKLDAAAERLNVSRSTLKRICRLHGITRWKPLKRKRNNLSLQEPTMHLDESVQDGSGTMVQTSLATTSLRPTVDLDSLWLY